MASNSELHRSAGQTQEAAEVEATIASQKERLSSGRKAAMQSQAYSLVKWKGGGVSLE